MPRTLHLGSAGDDVKFLQEQLNSHPPTTLPLLTVDGNFGPKTAARVQEYQGNNALFIDGLVGPLTWGALLGHATRETTGLFVLGRNVYDRLGTTVLLRGINKMSVWDNAADQDPGSATSFFEMKKTGANSVRIVWAITSNLEPDGPATSTETLDTFITNAKANHLIPMIELHDATGQWSRLNDLVNYWTQPSVVSILQKHQAYLLVNIGNEVGDDTVSQADFTAGYSDAIGRMRAAGIHTPLVIDAPGWGKNLTMLNTTAATLLAADPDFHLLFSVHWYCSKACGADEAFIRSRLQEAVDLGYPLIVGEFSHYGGDPCVAPRPNQCSAEQDADLAASKCSAAGEIDYQTILSACHEHHIGWYVWEWGPGNSQGNPPDPLCVVMDMTPDRHFAHLKPGWAHDVAIDSPFGILKTSVTPSSI
jgi:mannan endo-1,4-beta-mannosidase